jgi:sulfate transport system ATP-binding protein
MKPTARPPDESQSASAGNTAPEAPRVPAAAVIGVSKSFQGVQVLDDIHCEVGQGEALVMLGASGSGKTTLLRIIAGLEEPDSGQVMLQGRDVTSLPPRQRGVGVIFQDYALFPRMTVAENIGFGLRIRRRPRREIDETITRLLALVRLEEHRDKMPSQLSGGQRQRVAIARVLAYQPQILLFDEPFGALDAQTRINLRREIRSLLREVNVSAIFITHDQEEALEIGDRIAVLHEGRIEQVGPPEQVYNSPGTEYVATFLGAANLLLGVVRRGAIEIGSTTIPARDEVRRFRNGQSVKLVFRPEDVVVSTTKTLPAGARPMGYGMVEEAHFVGAYERVTVRANLFPPRRPQIDPLVTAVADEDSDSQLGIPLIVTRAKSEAAARPLRIGQSVAIGVTALRVLPNYTMAVERASHVVEMDR